jgi:hypothetical protein
MNEFVTFVQELFPSISPYTAERSKTVISDLIKGKGSVEICTTKPFEFIAQGDILSEIPFQYTNEDGEDEQLSAMGIVLTNTCDAERERFLLVAPVFPIELYLEQGLDETNIRNNKYTKLFYLPSAILNDHVADLNIINNFPRILIDKLIQREMLEKVATLNLFGYYLFLAKLTVHLMRPEDLEVNDNRRVTIGA